MSSRVLITGAGGFAGGYVSGRLASQGYDVFGLVGNEPLRSIDGVKAAITVDLRNFNELRTVVADIKPTHVIHLAAISFVDHEDVSEIYQTNIVGSRNLLLALDCLLFKPKSIILTSSANVYGNSPKELLDESSEVNPANDYAVSKIGMEYMSRQFESRLNITVARPFNYTGVGQSPKFLVPKIVQHFRDRKAKIELGNIDVARDFSDVRIVAQYFQAILENRLAIGKTYNICSGNAYSLDYIISACKYITGHDIEVEVNPAFVRENEVKSLAGNPERLYKDFGNLASYQFKDTLRWMLES